ncbi:MAG TPA: ATP-binding cassette domain-containing protein, partial [Flavisolibacter sp.]|nr:ATP-binding cassette domain-containing protein [Flavisolibacter sp.]
NGNYSFYEREKSERVELQQRAFENQQDYIRQQEKFVERFKAKASKAAAAQSIVKRLDRLDRIENVEIERPNIRINFSVDKTPGRVLVELKNVSKKFKDVEILEGASAEIDRGDKIALIGANGKGKSTLLRIIAGVEPHEGERKWGHNVEESFYAQHQLEALNMNHTILDEMRDAGAKKTDLELRSLLGCFLFSGDDADKKIKILSGGEKARVALAKTITSKANFLLLDEPTNHLDIHSNELLIDALNRYQGTFVLVSHDRYFISKTANKIWEIVDQEIKEFKGGYEEWVAWKERMAASPVEKEKKNKQSDRSNPGTKHEDNSNGKPKQSAQSLPINKEAKKELHKQQQLFQQAETRLAELNKEKALLESKLAASNTYENAEDFKKTETSYKLIQQHIAAANKEYEEAFEKVLLLEAE